VLKVGLLGGKMGTGTVRVAESERVELDVALDALPPEPLSVTLLLALPRPKVLRRIVQAVTTAGVKRLALFGAFRVEKSYWQTPWLSDEELREQIVLGLEQAGDTVLPVITLHPLFRPFIEDTVPGLAAGSMRLLAEPGTGRTCPAAAAGPVTLAVGPEGGFTEHELAMLGRAGFETVTLGRRAWRTEHVVPALLGRLMI